jgi:hypothetical protein
MSYTSEPSRKAKMKLKKVQYLLLIDLFDYFLSFSFVSLESREVVA